MIRQFVAMPLGAGCSVEEQLTGKAEVGGMQFQVYPMRPEAYFRERVLPSLPTSLANLLFSLFNVELFGRIAKAPGQRALAEMGLGAGGQLRREIYADPYDFAEWDQSQTSRRFVHLANSMIWRQIIPWFDYYRDDRTPLKASKRLAAVKSIALLGEEKQSQPLPENTSIAPELIIQYGNTRRPQEMREFQDTP